VGGRLRRLTALAACVAALAACGSGSQAHGVWWKVEKNPFRIVVLRDGKTVVEQDAAARLRYQLAATGVQHKLTRVLSRSGSTYHVATDEPGRRATVTVDRTSSGVRVRTRLQPAAGVQQLYDAFRSARGERFLGGGEQGEHIDMRGQIAQIKVSYECAYAPVPFFVSTRGYGVSVGGTPVAALAFAGSKGGEGCVFGSTPPCAFPPLADRTELCVKGPLLDERIYVGTPLEVQRAYTRVAGRQVVPPRSELALVKWRDEISSASELLEDIDRLRAARVPIGWVLLDNPWEQCVGRLQWDRSRIPNPARTIAEVHRRRVKFMLWVSPDVLCPAGYPPSQVLHGPVGGALDLENPAAVAEFERRLRRVFALGVDGVKGDRGDEVDLEPRGLGAHNRYPQLFARAVQGVLRERHGDDFGTIFRAASAGEQRFVHGIWAGDQPGDWIGLQRAVRLGQTAGVAGFSVWGSDVGGYSSASLTPDVFARWAQLGAVSPVLEVGGAGPQATPWVLGPQAMEALRRAATLHYELFPYFYRLLRRGEPIIQPLGLRYPDDAAAWEAELEFLVGPDVLAAPVTGPGTTPRVYLPRGRWIDLHAGRTVRGGVAFTRTTPLLELPLYVRAGAVIPFNLRTRDSWWGVDELARADRAGWLAGNGATLDLRGQPGGVQIFVPAASRPARVLLGGRTVRWTWNAGPLPGVVVRVAGPRVRGKIKLSEP
jgi:alpha-D-xyloside xylohydrolase